MNQTELLADSARTTAIVVHYGDPLLTRRAVSSILSAHHRPGRVVVVDNGPGRLSPEAVADAEILRPHQNLGFAGGVNFALESAGHSDHYWLVNNDAVVDPDALAQLLLALRRHEGRALVSSRVIHAHTKQPWFERARFLPWRLEGRHERSVHPETDVVSRRKPSWREAAYVSGCSLLVPASALAEVGGLDSAFFVYGEDVDLSIRALQADWALVVAAQSVVHHAASSGSTLATQERLKAETSLLLTWRYHPWLAPMAILGGLITGIKRAVTRRQSWWVASRIAGYSSAIARLIEERRVR